MLIGYKSVFGRNGVQHAFNPITNTEIIEPQFGLGGTIEVEQAASLAAAAFDVYRDIPLTQRAVFLETIADEIIHLGDTLIERAHAETGLPIARLQGERTRTVGQLHLFAQVVRDGRFLSATIDTAIPQRQPLPRSDIRLSKVPLGPVVVFGASNFPLAFSVAGGDTASALAAGNSVIVKAHSAHLGTSELVGRAIQKAAQKTGMPEGVFSLLIGAGNEIGKALVAHPAIKAVGFTGSRQGGLSIQRIANERHEPIPVYAEMSSINPVFLLPLALSNRAEAIGQAFIDSLTLGAGQFCTNPGLILAIDGPDLQRFIKAVSVAVKKKSAQTMLTRGIHKTYQTAISQINSISEVKQIASGLEKNGQNNAAQAFLYLTDAQKFLQQPALQSEIFGPAAIIIKVKDLNEMIQVAEYIEGQLTATLQLDLADHENARKLIPILERKVGRILVNGFPTGVEVCHAMVHGGPFPSTSNAMHTSVGSSAIERFLRPVCYQDFPDSLLPKALQNNNPLGFWRLINGEITKQ
ncbi:aldehyde dehydrogenase (NADP(+)) [Acinetobacter baumannii]|uniref:aldehyde dehydrogenase (NADP(+)) n=2 Tax=Acinetobacter TaxID=469 RepID=UPI0038CD2BE8